ncbi:MAG TPA: DUF4912 domain-containing protein [Candidatus Rifleibacterium sp.]|nr:DUF4912 domain-containing protein [Candidatus Rifleibacterium sp.]
MNTRFTARTIASLNSQELYALARDLDIAGRASLTRAELIKVLQLLLVEPPVSRSMKQISHSGGVPRLVSPSPTPEILSQPLSAPEPADTKDHSAPEAPRRGRPPKAKPEAPVPALVAPAPRRGRPPKAKPEAPVPAPVAPAPRRGRPPKVKPEAPVLAPVAPAPRRGRPPKAKPEAPVPAPVAPAPRRGRPPKAKPEAPVPAPVAPAPRRGRPPKAKPEAPVPAPIAPAPRRGRPPKAKPEAPVPAPVAPAPRRGRPPKAKPEAPVLSLVDDFVMVEPVTLTNRNKEKEPRSVARFNRECEEEAAALKRLNRAFAKRGEETPHSEKKRGAEVLEAAVAMPVHASAPADDKKTTNRAEQIETERRRKHSSLKTTMEIPVFAAPLTGASSTVSEDELTGDLPEFYDETRIVLQIRDPHWAHAYWELPPVERKRLELEVGIFEFAHSHFVLRLHNVTLGHTEEITLSENARSWYIHLHDAQCVYQVELGLQSPSEGYNFVALSNLVQTPPDKVAQRWAEPVAPQPAVPELPLDQQLPADTLAAGDSAQPVPPTAYLTDLILVYGNAPKDRPMAFTGASELSGARQPADLGDMPTSRPSVSPVSSSEIPYMPGSISQMPTSSAGHLAMPGSASLPSSDVLSSPALTTKASADAIFCVAADLLVYGSAPAGWQLFFMGRQVEVRADGSFSLRLALPEHASQRLELTAVDPQTGQKKVLCADFAFKKRAG